MTSTQPALFEVMARYWAPRGLAAVPDEELDRIAALGFDHLWLMGAWTLGTVGPQVSQRMFPSVPADEIAGSPYAIARYEVAPELGGRDALANLRKRLDKRSMGLILDFVPNHTARDHDWVKTNPELYVRVPSGIAAGKDPYFDPWPDTAQLDLRLAGTWVRMLDTLQSIAQQCDGVRCDMAMLALSDVFAKTWEHAPPQDSVVQGEFWAAMIDHVDLLWIAEAYWGLETRLQQLGFDFTYDKALYDKLVHGDATAVREYIAALSPDMHARSLRFLENHDEPRLAATLPPERAAAALTIAMTLPGMRLVHDGEIEGRRIHANIHLAHRPDETPDAFSAELHRRILPVKREGSFGMLHAEDPRLVAHRWGSDLAVIVNYSPERVRSHVTLDLHGRAGRRIVLEDLMDGATYERNGSAPLYVDLRPWQAHVFAVTTKGLWNG